MVLWKRLFGILPIFLISSFSCVAQDYGKILDQEWKKILSLDKHDGDFEWFGYPVDNFGVFTSYAPPPGRTWTDGDRICATWSCLEIDTSQLPKDDPSHLSVNGFADVGRGASVSLTEKQAKKVALGLLIPQLAQVLKLSSDVNWSKGINVTMTIDAIYKRSVNKDKFMKFIKQQSTNDLLKGVFHGGGLVYVDADIVAQNVNVTLTVDSQKNAKADAALQNAVSQLAAGSAASVSIQSQGSGVYLFRIPTFAVLAVLIHNPGPGALFNGSNYDPKTDGIYMPAVPTPQFDAKTLQPIERKKTTFSTYSDRSNHG
jgi:hypothetical protein